MRLESAIGFKKSVPMFERDECLPLPLELMGVEIEVEGMTTYNRSEPPPLWTETTDDSLRNYGREYIFSEPLYGTGITDALVDMAFFLDKAKPSISYRCSVHVHMNVSDMDAEQLLSLIVLYLIFERTLVKYHGNEREDNIFCIPFYKAPDSLRPLVHLFEEVEQNGLSPSTTRMILESFNKYSALNINAILVHGSLEFRHMAGTADMNKVFEWIKIIQYLKKAALEHDTDYVSMLNSASGHTSSLLERVFNECAESLKYPDMTNDIMAGARIAQRLVHGSKMDRPSNVELDRRYNKATKEKLDTIKGKIGKVTPSPVDEEVEDNYINLRQVFAPPPNTAWVDDTGVNTTTSTTDDIWSSPTRQEIEAMLRELEEAQTSTRGTE